MVMPELGMSSRAAEAIAVSIDVRLRKAREAEAMSIATPRLADCRFSGPFPTRFLRTIPIDRTGE